MADSPVVLGLDFGGTKIAMAVCDPAGQRLGFATVPSGPGARATFDLGVTAARDLLAATAPGCELAAVGVATFGIPFEDRVELAPNIGGWSDLPMGRDLRAAFPGAAVRMATDVKAATLAEARWGALAGCDPGIYLNLGTGLAAGIVAGGQLLRGRDGAAGEIGYSLRSMADVGVPAAGRTLLEEMISGQALARRADRRTAGGEPMAARDIFAASRNDPALDALVADFVAELAFHVVNLSIALNPARIAVGGGMAASWDRLEPGLRAALETGVPFPPELVLARFPDDAPLIGAVALAVDAAGAAAAGRDGTAVAPDTFAALGGASEARFSFPSINTQ